MAEVLEEEVIDCVALFYEEVQGGGNYRKKNEFRCRVKMCDKRLVKFREAIWLVAWFTFSYRTNSALGVKVCLS